jgi:hypothetical protein
MITTPLTEDKVNRAAYGHFDAHAKGLTQDIMKIKIAIDLDTSTKTIAFSRIDPKPNQQRLILTLKQEELFSLVALEKVLDDPKTLVLRCHRMWNAWLTELQRIF